MKTVIGLGASLALHASVALVLVLQPTPEAPKVQPPLRVTKPATRVALASPAPRPAAAKPPAKQVRARRPVAAVTEAPAEAPAAPEAEPAPLAGEPAGVAGTEAAVEESPLAPALTPTREEGAPTFDTAALHAALAESARRCYPAAAKRFHLTGEAQLDFCLDPSGALKSTRLASSTGQSMLDAAAKDCVLAGAMPLPAEASGGCYSVPVRFR